MGLTVDKLSESIWGHRRAVFGDVHFDNSYASGGEELTAAMMGLCTIEEVLVSSPSRLGYNISHYHSDGKHYLKVFSPIPTITPASIVVKDLDAAAAIGVAVYLHTKDGRNGWFEFVSPTNTDGNGTLSNGGAGYFVFDSDAAATDGVAIYFDEDAAAVDGRLMCISPSGQDIYVPVAGSGQLIRIAHSATANVAGVNVYFDEDRANTYERLMFVSPTNANGVGATDDGVHGVVSASGAGSEVPAATNLSSLTDVRVVAIGY